MKRAVRAPAVGMIARNRASVTSRATATACLPNMGAERVPAGGRCRTVGRCEATGLVQRSQAARMLCHNSVASRSARSIELGLG